MECKLAQYISDEISEKAKTVTNFSLEMNSYFEGKEYGSGLREIVIGIICVSFKFEEFFKIGQPIYTKSKRTRKVDIEIEIERTPEYNIKIDYETFKSSNVEQTQKLLAASIMDSLDVFERVKIVDFDSEQFKMDLQNCFKVMRVA